MLALEYLNFGGTVQQGIFRLKVRLVIMVAVTILNGKEYISCEECGAYELLEVSKLHVVQDGAKEFLCRQCMPVSCVVSKGQVSQIKNDAGRKEK